MVLPHDMISIPVMTITTTNTTIIIIKEAERVLLGQFVKVWMKVLLRIGDFWQK